MFTVLLTSNIMTIGPAYAAPIINPAVTVELGGDPDGEAVVGRLLARFFSSALAVAAILFLLYLVSGAYKWLTSGADKAQLQAAQGTMTQALIGLTILASIFAAARIVGILLGLSCPAGNFPDVICWPGIPTAATPTGGGAGPGGGPLPGSF